MLSPPWSLTAHILSLFHLLIFPLALTDCRGERKMFLKHYIIEILHKVGKKWSIWVLVDLLTLFISGYVIVGMMGLWLPPCFLVTLDEVNTWTFPQIFCILSFFNLYCWCSLNLALPKEINTSVLWCAVAFIYDCHWHGHEEKVRKKRREEIKMEGGKGDHGKRQNCNVIFRRYRGGYPGPCGIFLADMVFLGFHTSAIRNHLHREKGIWNCILIMLWNLGQDQRTNRRRLWYRNWNIA